MKSRRLHRVLGLLLVLPILGWVVTGFLFHVKPGWSEAYDLPRVQTLSLAGMALPELRDDWHELRLLRTVLGDHLLVRTDDGWQHLEPTTLEPRPEPSPEDLRRLLDASLAEQPRYGTVREVDGLSAVMETGVRVRLSWSRLSLSQRGDDTDLIDRLYEIHYLRWTGITMVDRVLSVLGLVSLLALSVLGVMLALRRPRSS